MEDITKILKLKVEKRAEEHGKILKVGITAAAGTRLGLKLPLIKVFKV